jgi:flagellar biosynthesis/type III secretory pathway M-ring protein FliF/YscJ
MNNSDAGGWLWLVMDVGFVVVLAAALIYGIVMWRTRSRNPVVENQREQATKRLFEREDSAR